MHCLIIQARREARSCAPTCSLSQGEQAGQMLGKGLVLKVSSEGLRKRKSEIICESAEVKVVLLFKTTLFLSGISSTEMCPSTFL